MPKKINETTQHDELLPEDSRWYSSIKNKIDQLTTGYGAIELVLTVKGGRVVAVNHITKGSENIG